MVLLILLLGTIALADDIVLPAPLTLVCGPKGNAYELQRVDGTAIGDVMTLQECNAVSLLSRQGAVCALFSNDWYPTRIQDGARLGEATSFDDCQAAVAAAKADLVCSKTPGGRYPWRPTHIPSGNAVGRYGTLLSDCAVLTKNASTGVVCTNTGTYEFRGRKPTRVGSQRYSDADLMGASGQQAFCTKATRLARKGTVCVCNGDFCGPGQWLLYEMKTKQPINGAVTTDLDSCIQAQAP